MRLLNTAVRRLALLRGPLVNGGSCLGSIVRSPSVLPMTTVRTYAKASVEQPLSPLGSGPCSPSSQAAALSCSAGAGANAEEEASNEDEPSRSNPYLQMSTEDLISFYKSLSQTAVSLEQYNQILFVLRLNKAAPEALEVLNDMKNSQLLQPDADSYGNAFLSGTGLFNADELEALILSHLTPNSRTQGRGSPMPASGISKTQELRNRLAAVYLEAVKERKIKFGGNFFGPLIRRCLKNLNRKEFAELGYVFARHCLASEIQINTSCYSSLMAALQAHGLEDLIVSLYDFVSQSRLAGGESAVDASYHLEAHLVRAFVRQGNAERALATIDRFAKLFPQSLYAFDMWIRAALKEQNLALARVLFTKMQSLGRSPTELTISLFLDHASLGKDEALFDEFVALAESLNIAPGSSFYAALVKFYSRLGRWADASATVKRAVDSQSVDRKVMESIVTWLTEKDVPPYSKLEAYQHLNELISGKTSKDEFVQSLSSIVDHRLLECFALIEELKEGEVAALVVARGFGVGPTTKSERAYTAIGRSLLARRQTEIFEALIQHILSTRIFFDSRPAMLFNMGMTMALRSKDLDRANAIYAASFDHGASIKPELKEACLRLRAESRSVQQQESRGRWQGNRESQARHHAQSARPQTSSIPVEEYV